MKTTGDKHDWRNAARLLKLLGHPLRLELLDNLTKGPRCVNDIRDLVDIPQANVSQHLAVLRSAGLVACHEQGNLRCYYLLRPQLVRGMLDFVTREHAPVKNPPAEARRAARCRQLRTSSPVMQTG